MTVIPFFPECPECGGKGWRIGNETMYDPPEQIQCERCGGDGVIDSADKPDNSEPMGTPEAEGLL